MYQRFSSHPLMLLFAGFLFAAIVGGITFFTSAKGISSSGEARVVIVSYDNQRQTLPTQAGTVKDFLQRIDVKLNEGDRVEPALTTDIQEDNFRINVYRARPVTVIDNDGMRTTALSAATTPRSMADQAGVKVYPEDKVKTEVSDNILKDQVLGEKVVIDRATPANVNLYGTQVAVRTHATKVGDLLDEKKIKLAEGDTVQPSRDTVLTANTQVFVIRNGSEIISAEEVIAAPVQTIEDGNLTSGTNAVRQAGSDGKKLVTYQVNKQNGVEVSRSVIQETIVTTPVERIVVKGTKFIISNPSANVAIGQRLAAERGWTGGEFQCLYNLWQKESGWNHNANNRSSGAYGIPQSLPGSKMASVGADWQTNPETQIKWGFGYIAGRYGSPCGAWNHSKARGWY